MLENLPEFCYVEHTVTKKPVKVVKGVSGYYPLEQENFGLTTNELNKALGVTKQQADAMLIGSMFGWDAPGANPKFFKKD